MSVLPRGVCARYAWTMVFSWQPQSYKYNRKRTARSQGVRDAVTSPNKWRGTLIIGMGVDIAEVERIQGAIERYGEVFLKRVCTGREREYCERFKNKYEGYAGRFAVKEAAMKALGTGWRRGVRWVDFEVVRETGGRRTLAITGEAARIAGEGRSRTGIRVAAKCEDAEGALELGLAEGSGLGFAQGAQVTGAALDDAAGDFVRECGGFGARSRREREDMKIG